MGLLNRVGVLAVGTALVLVVGQTTAVAQTKEARGQVTAVTDSSLTVKTAESTMTFVVSRDTHVEAKGASTRKRQSANAGKEANIKITDYLKAGSAVLVSYREAGGQNQAVNIRPISSAGSTDAAAPPTKNVQGKVKSISGDTLTLDQDGKDLRFTVDRETDVLAKGGTRATKKAGGTVPIGDLIHAGDLVRVQYREANGTMKALEVQLRAPASIPAK